MTLNVYYDKHKKINLRNLYSLLGIRFIVKQFIYISSFFITFADNAISLIDNIPIFSLICIFHMY